MDPKHAPEKMFAMPESNINEIAGLDFGIRPHRQPDAPLHPLRKVRRIDFENTQKRFNRQHV